MTAFHTLVSFSDSQFSKKHDGGLYPKAQSHSSDARALTRLDTGPWFTYRLGLQKDNADRNTRGHAGARLALEGLHDALAVPPFNSGQLGTRPATGLAGWGPGPWEQGAGISLVCKKDPWGRRKSTQGAVFDVT